MPEYVVYPDVKASARYSSPDRTLDVPAPENPLNPAAAPPDRISPPTVIGKQNPPNQANSTSLNLSTLSQPATKSVTIQARPVLRAETVPAESPQQIFTNTESQLRPSRSTNGPATKPGPVEEPGFSILPSELGTQVFRVVKDSFWVFYLLALLVGAAMFYARSRAGSSKKYRAMYVTPLTATACDARANRTEPVKPEPPAVPNGRTVSPARRTCAG